MRAAKARITLDFAAAGQGPDLFQIFRRFHIHFEGTGRLLRAQGRLPRRRKPSGRGCRLPGLPRTGPGEGRTGAVKPVILSMKTSF